MNVWVPHVDGAAFAVVKAMPEDAMWVSVAATDLAYWGLLDTLWAAGETFILNEHDVVPWKGAHAEMWDCHRDWCAVPYNCDGIMTPALGCTKFSSSLLHRLPDVVRAIPAEHRQWFNLDGLIVGTLHQHREAEHLHYPAARHLKYEEH